MGLSPFISLPEDISVKKKTTDSSLKESRIPEVPPFIEPVSFLEHRPLLSVMIPTYNCISYVGKAIESVLSQDMGPGVMQIEVIDDCSTDGNLEELVNRIGKGRVKLFRQPYNKGSLRNFETCINRAKGHWIHILHGDDYVKPDFYNEIKSLFDTYPDAGAAFTNHLTINPDGKEGVWVEKLLDKPMIVDGLLERIAQRNFIQPPAVVVKRKVYEHLGSFFGVHFGEDWEMWARIGANYKVAYSPKLLAAYRIHENNITDHSHTSSQSVTDIHKVINIIQNYLPADKKRELKEIAVRNFSIYFALIAHQMYYNQTDSQPAIRLCRKAITMHANRTTLYQYIMLNLKILINWKSLKKGLKYINTFLLLKTSNEDSLVTKHTQPIKFQ